MYIGGFGGRKTKTRQTALSPEVILCYNKTKKYAQPSSTFRCAPLVWLVVTLPGSLTPPSRLSPRLHPVTPLVTPLSFGWFVALPRDSAFRTNGCRVASRHVVASCASTPLIRESDRRRLPPLSSPHPSRTTSPSPEREREQRLPEHRCFCCRRGARPLPERGLPRRCRRRGRPRSRPSPAPPPPHRCLPRTRPSPGRGPKEGASPNG
jgi:hypothetical protein